jgi:hypothetical protein
MHLPRRWSGKENQALSLWRLAASPQGSFVAERLQELELANCLMMKW